MTTDVARPATDTGTLPRWPTVLAVVAHPDDESFGLGAVLDAFVRSGAGVSVLCLTPGGASSVSGVGGDLRTLRGAELRSAATALGVASAVLGDHMDGALAQVDQAVLVDEVSAATRMAGAEGLIVFDLSGVTGNPDHVAASSATLEAAKTLNLPVLGWTLPRAVADQLNAECGTGFVGHEPAEIDIVLPVDRDRQVVASLAHGSQAVPTRVLWRRLELLGDTEHLRWLRRADPAGAASATSAPGDPDVATMRVDYQSGDRFDISIRDHTVTVDQPVDVGGEDVGPTPTELFVAALASCVAFYARRYLRRHKLDATGLSVEASYRMGAKPARVSHVDVRIHLPAELPPARRDGLLAVASHCTVHNSITNAPEITVAL